jgi:hypothetical protein
MLQNLEEMIGIQKQRNFKSCGERRIGHFMDNHSIRYRYEPGLLVESVGHKLRIWYPDFYLPDFGAYIEYYGMVGQRQYERGIKTKQAVYQKMGIDVIGLYPWMLKQNWQRYIMKELKNRGKRRYRHLSRKTYGLKRAGSYLGKKTGFY